jgi:hypothetical protein
VGDGAFVFGWPNWANFNKAISAFLLAPLEFAGAGDMLKQVISQLCCAPVELDHRLINNREAQRSFDMVASCQEAVPLVLSTTFRLQEPADHPRGERRCGSEVTLGRR